MDSNKKIFHEEDKYKQKDGFIKNYVELKKIHDDENADDSLKKLCLDEMKEIKGHLGEKEFERLLLIEQTIKKQEKENPTFKL